MRRRGRAGMTMAECIAAIGLLGLVLMASVAFVNGAPTASARAEAAREAQQAVVNLLEGVRGGAVPMVSGAVDPTPWVTPRQAGRLTLRLDVAPGGAPGLTEVTAKARYQVRGRGGERSVTTLVWRAR